MKNRLEWTSKISNQMVLEGDVFYKFYNHFIYKFFGLILHLLNRCFISCVKDTSDVFFTFSSKYPTH